MSSVAEVYAPITDQLDKVQRVFEDELVSEMPFVNELCEHLLGFRGKMLRPALLLLSAEACGRIEREHVILAAAIEMVHMASLVHDDVLDEALIRRGMQSINYAHGNEAAVMLGDYLFSHAFHLCSGLDSQYASRLVGSTANTICEGELLQICNRGNYGLTEQEYFDIITRKTASLTGTSCVLGAKYAGADPPTIARMEAFGMEVGTAFQIVDDLLDITGTEQEMGKTLGLDVGKGKATLPVIRYLATAGPNDRHRAIQLLTGNREDRREKLFELLEESDALSYTEQAARRYIRSAVANLDDVPPSAAKDSLRATVEFILIRRN